MRRLAAGGIRCEADGMLSLPSVTLVCIDTVNHDLAVRALALSSAQIRFARVVFATAAIPPDLAIPTGVEVATIPALTSRDAYSRFVLKDLLPLVQTSHMLLVQWDGYVVNPDAWSPAFLDCDYLGATWFWRDDGMRVGNGGFSLRSRRLLEALQDPKIEMMEAEDITICRTYRDLLERKHGIRFGDEATADRFSFETDYPTGRPFGFHGLFNFWRVVPPAELRSLPARFSDAVARSPQLDQLMQNCMHAGMWAPGAAVARRILASDPGNEYAQAIAADAEAQLAQAPESALDRPPREPVPDEYVERGKRAQARGELAGADREYRAALRLAPEHAMAWYHYGVVARARKQHEKSLHALREAVRLAPDFADARVQLAAALADRSLRKRG